MGPLTVGSFIPIIAKNALQRFGELDYTFSESRQGKLIKQKTLKHSTCLCREAIRRVD